MSLGQLSQSGVKTRVAVQVGPIGVRVVVGVHVRVNVVSYFCGRRAVSRYPFQYGP